MCLGSKRMMLLLPILIVVLVLIHSPIALGQTPADTQNEIKRLQGEIASSRVALAEANASYQASLAEVRSIDAKAHKTEADLISTNVRLVRLKNKLSQRATYFYKAGPSSILSVLTESQDFADFAKRGAFVMQVLAYDSELVHEVAALEKTLRASTLKLSTERNKQAKMLAQTESRRAQVARQLAMQQSKLSSLTGAIPPTSGRFAMALPAAGGRAPTVSRGGARTGFVFPVAGSHRYVNSWGARRSGGRRHKGTDIMANRGTNVVACVSGTIKKTSPVSRSLGGITIWLDGDDGNEYYYAHLNSIVPGITPGTRVEAGQLIGYVGDTGNARGTPHLHFEIHPGGGGAINPYPTLTAADR